MNIFNNISSRRPQSSEFNLSHNRKFGTNPGLLTPTLCQEILPSDKWDYKMSALLRFSPMQAPVMHMVDVYNYSFFVPARLTMKRGDFETFITGGKAGDGKDALGNTIQIPFCKINFTGATSTAASIDYTELAAYFGSGNPDSLADFLGVQMGDIFPNANTRDINMMPFIAFWRIWCQYFRDQNLHPDYESLYPGIFDASGDITAAIFTAMITNALDPLKYFPFFKTPQVCWEKDYFTSALPFAQRGTPVSAPLAGNATITYRTQAIVLKAATAQAGDLQAGTLLNAPLVHTQIPSGTSTPAGLDNIQNISLTSGGFTINQLRLATRLQEWLEKMARGGARYIEQIKQQFGVTSSDARLQRPEFLGGGKIPVHISEVLQTSPPTDSGAPTPLGEMAGHGVSSGNINNFRKFFEEHGFLISVMFVRPKTAYQEGLSRLYTRRFDKLDWAWPSFAHLGEQEIRNEELYFRNNATDQQTFGYQARYAEYKYIPSTVHSDFRDELNFWHWGRIFAATGPIPTLSKEFVESRPDPRIFNVIDPAYSKIYCIVNNTIKARRPLPYFSSPTL